MDFTFHPGVNGSDPWVEFYPYNPSLTAGYAFMAIFGLATLAHIVLMLVYKAAYFIPFVLGGICETFGYYGRARSHNARTEIGPWAQQQMLLLCAPPLLAASVYMTLSRIITALGAEHHSPIRPKWLTVLFVLNDIICLLTQLVGAGLQVTGDAQIIDIGIKAVLAGLVFTLVVFVGFVLVAVKVHRRVAAHPTRVSVEFDGKGAGWRGYMWCLYVVCGCMIVRNLVRTVEFGAPKGADVRRREGYIYVFDGALMAVLMGVWIIWHPGRLVKRARSVKRGVDGNLELLGNK
ncbi:RTA1-domain-containing protein [Aspergillus campestris IBT 28561]|uniref:RTA1-domain-containing protein n=1 Tax=Aspergillus campestris (strain IBT 28561) TaxID=1392248 RepID=A0A2I1CX20_ASPC2|nr:RTA1-domain-containing protein [Aspergillus campestris IBT 28561]PKY02162.1 RTA1-domain-containing protein [Aspergillus campestris IBT 28561]